MAYEYEERTIKVRGPYTVDAFKINAGLDRQGFRRIWELEYHRHAELYFDEDEEPAVDEIEYGGPEESDDDGYKSELWDLFPSCPMPNCDHPIEIAGYCQAHYVHKQQGRLGDEIKFRKYTATQRREFLLSGSKPSRSEVSVESPDFDGRVTLADAGINSYVDYRFDPIPHKTLGFEYKGEMHLSDNLWELIRDFNDNVLKPVGHRSRMTMRPNQRVVWRQMTSACEKAGIATSEITMLYA